VKASIGFVLVLVVLDVAVAVAGLAAVWTGVHLLFPPIDFERARFVRIAKYKIWLLIIGAVLEAEPCHMLTIDYANAFSWPFLPSCAP
jgi:hypothetical protein